MPDPAKEIDAAALTYMSALAALLPRTPAARQVENAAQAVCRAAAALVRAEALTTTASREAANLKHPAA